MNEITGSTKEEVIAGLSGVFLLCFCLPEVKGKPYIS